MNDSPEPLPPYRGDRVHVVGFPETLEPNGISLVLIVNRAHALNAHGFVYAFFRKAPMQAGLRRFADANRDKHSIFIGHPVLIDTGERYFDDDACKVRVATIQQWTPKALILWPPLEMAP